MLEAEVRDYFEKNLSVIAGDLTLVEKEYFIPNDLGTRGFVDLLARDAAGLYVFIELKRSDAAARQALHEVVKYLEGAKRHLGLKDAEMRVVIASTEWSELLVPFSRFVHDMPIQVEGLRLTIQSDRSVTASRVQPLPIQDGRTLSPWHELNLYHDETSLRDGVSSYEEFCNAHSISDYFIMIMKPRDEMYTCEIEQFEYIAYFVMKQLSDAECAAIVSAATGDDPEKLEELDVSEDDSRSHNYHMFILDLEPRCRRDYFEIGYPAKFKNKLLQDEGWKIVAIERYGIFARNLDLSDTTLIEEVGAISGETGQSLKRQVVLANKSQYSSLIRDLAICLRDNPVWLAQITAIVDTLKKNSPDCSIDIHVYNPCRGVFVLYDFATKEDGNLYAPTYEIKVEDKLNRREYFGDLVEDGDAKSFREVVNEFYEGDVGRLMLAKTWGCYEKRDGEILESLGLSYRSVRIDLEDNNSKFYVLRNQRWREIDEVLPLHSLSEYLQNNPGIISDIVGAIKPRDFGGMVDMSPGKPTAED